MDLNASKPFNYFNPVPTVHRRKTNVSKPKIAVHEYSVNSNSKLIQLMQKVFALAIRILKCIRRKKTSPKSFCYADYFKDNLSFKLLFSDSFIYVYSCFSTFHTMFLFFSCFGWRWRSCCFFFDCCCFFFLLLLLFLRLVRMFRYGVGYYQRARTVMSLWPTHTEYNEYLIRFLRKNIWLGSGDRIY